jgi:hypothetical protein
MVWDLKCSILNMQRDRTAIDIRRQLYAPQWRTKQTSRYPGVSHLAHEDDHEDEEDDDDSDYKDDDDGDGSSDEEEDKEDEEQEEEGEDEDVPNEDKGRDANAANN